MREKYLTANDIFNEKKIGDIVVFKSNLIKAKIVDKGIKHHFAEAFFGANNVYQEIKYIKFLYLKGETSIIESHDRHRIKYTALLNNPIYGKNKEWNEYYFLCGGVYLENKIQSYKKYVKGEFDSKRISERDYLLMLNDVNENGVKIT